MRVLLLSITALCLTVQTPARGQEATFGGQIRPRFEFRDPGALEDAFISMRVRGNLTAELDRNIRVFVQYQDVRLWGSETSTLNDFSADGFDLHQAYFELTREGDTRLAARVGRQEVNLGGERLVGAVGWTQQGRAFDGVLLTAATDAVQFDLFGALLADRTAATQSGDAFLVAAYAQVQRVGPGVLDLFGLWNRVDGLPTEQTTLGARWWGSDGPIRFRAEAAWQTGERLGQDVSAFMLGGRVGKVFERSSLTLWYDYLSGDDDATDGELKVFDTLFATNHKFYGLADLFLDIPTHTGGRGLHDIAVKGTHQPGPDVTLALDLHSFRLARGAGLASGHLAEEIDLTAGYRYSANARFTAGLSQVFMGDGMTAIGRPGDDTTWFYVMTDVTF